MSKLLGAACVLIAAGAVAGVVYARRAAFRGEWAVGYSADFLQEDALHAAKNCTGRIYVNVLEEPRGVRRDLICGDRRQTDIFRQGETPVVLDPETKVYWRPEARSRLEVGIEPPRAESAQETVNGRRVYHFKNPIKQADGTETESEVWQDPKLHSPIRVVTAHSKYELTNIREGAQAETLFMIPEGYREIAAPKP
jgi:hypothetical protein